MPFPQLTADQVADISGLVAGYIRAQREKALPLALPLSPAQRASMDGFFLTQVLDTTRLQVLTESRVVNPPFYVPLRRMGFTNLPSFSTMAAVTFCDVVVSHQPFTDGLLFHELVHAEQYRQLGLRRFSELYVQGFLSSGGYDGIPLEINAYELGDRFEKSPGTRFPVADEVPLPLDSRAPFLRLKREGFTESTSLIQFRQDLGSEVQDGGYALYLPHLSRCEINEFYAITEPIVVADNCPYAQSHPGVWQLKGKIDRSSDRKF